VSDPKDILSDEPLDAFDGAGTDVPIEEPDPSAVLRVRLEAAEKQKTEYLDLLQRARADFENYQKRAARELNQERQYAQVPLARDLLPVLDNLDRAIGAAEEGKAGGPWVEGVVMVRTLLLDALRRHHIKPIEAMGKPFDPNLHQAVMQQPTAELEPNTVLQVVEQGFLLHDRVLRPARVIVSSALPG
jgi:molecular chaperone GrpE